MTSNHQKPSEKWEEECDRNNLCYQHGNKRQFCPDCLGILREGDYSYQIERVRRKTAQEIIGEVEKVVDNTQRRYFRENNDHEFLDTCDVYKLLQKLKNKIKERHGK